MGNIEVSVQGRSESLQTIEVKTEAHFSWLTKTFTVQDTDFDGFNDMVFLEAHASKAGWYQNWLFEPESGHFVRNRLAKELDELAGNQWERDPVAKKIRVSTNTVHLKHFPLDLFRQTKDCTGASHMREALK